MDPHRRSAVVVALALAAAGALSATHPAPTRAGQDTSWFDYNGDGFGDLAIGIPGEIVGGDDGAGAVQVLYGSAAGLTATDNEIWTQQLIPAAGPRMAEPGDKFGTALASGDFDDDGFADLAVGAPGEDTENAQGTVVFADAGSVLMLFGSADGLVAPALGHSFFNGNKAGDRAGKTLLAFDMFDAPQVDPGSGDGIADLAIARKDRVTIEPGGSRAMLTTIADRRNVSMPRTSNRIVLATGNGDDDDADEMVVGLPNAAMDAEHPFIQNAGAVVILDRKAAQPGNADVEAVLFYQETFGGQSHAGDMYGAALATGDITDEPLDDILVGLPGYDIESGNGPIVDAGAFVFFGDPRYLIQGEDGIPETPEAGDRFGSALAMGAFDTDPGVDVAVGAPGESVGTKAGAGAVLFLSSSEKAATVVHQNKPDIEGVASTGDKLGSALSAVDFGKGGLTDLAVGAPSDDEAGAADAGVVHVLYGSATGLTGTNDQLWSQASTSIPKDPTAGDLFGAAVH